MSWESFTLGNTHFGDTYNIYLGSDKTGMQEDVFLPSNEIYEETVSGMNGSYIYGQVIKPREFTLDVFAEDLDEYTIKKIKQELCFDKPKKLILDTSPHKFIYVVINNKQIDWKYVFHKNTYSTLIELPFIAYDPFFYSWYTSLDTYDYYDIHNVFSNESMDFNNIEIPPNIITNITDSINFNIYNHGNVNSKIIIGIKGTGNSINLTNNTINQQFDISNLANEGILINGLKGQITDGEIVSGQMINIHSLKTAKFDGDFIELKSGYNNFSLTGTDLNLESVSFLFRHTYI